MKLQKRILKSKFVIGLAAGLIANYIRFVGMTTRWTYIRADILEKDYRHKPFIITFWHGRLLMISYCTPKNAFANIIISGHSDGDLIEKVQKRFGFRAIRGSKANKNKNKEKGGSQAIRAMVKARKNNEVIAITPDGPRGPARKVGGYTVEIAKMLDLPIIPVTFSCTRHRIINSWDSFMLALPFGKGVFAVGEPIPPERSEELEMRMNELMEEADIAAKTL